MTAIGSSFGKTDLEWSLNSHEFYWFSVWACVHPSICATIRVWIVWSVTIMSLQILTLHLVQRLTWIICRVLHARIISPPQKVWSNLKVEGQICSNNVFSRHLVYNGLTDFNTIWHKCRPWCDSVAKIMLVLAQTPPDGL